MLKTLAKIKTLLNCEFKGKPFGLLKATIKLKQKSKRHYSLLEMIYHFQRIVFQSFFNFFKIFSKT